MSNRNLAFMSAVFVLLLGLYVFQKVAGRRSEAPSDEVQITVSFKVEDVQEIELVRGKDSVLIRRDGTDWRIPNTFNSKGDKKKIDSFLETLRDLKGQPRGKGAEFQKDVGLDSDKALHIALKGGGKEYERLLVGKRAPGFDRCFVRRASADEVFVAHRNLLSVCGLIGAEDPPKPQAWLDLLVAEVDRSKVVHLRLRGPATLYEFRREEKKKEEAVSKEGEKNEKKEEKKEYEWVQAREGLNYRAKKEGVERVLDELKSVKAEDVADPAKAGEYGFDAPQYELTATLEDKKQVVIQVGKEVPDKKGSFYARAGGSTVFVMSETGIRNLFPRGRDLLELPSPNLPRGGHRLLISSPHRVIDIVVEGRALKFAEPQIRQAPRLQKVQAYTGRLSDLKPEDVSTVADPREAGLDKPEHTVLFESELGNLEIRVGGKLAGKQRYVSFTGEPHIFLVADSDLSTLTPTIREFLDLRPWKVDKDSIQEIHSTVEGKPVRMVRRDPWECHLQGYPLTGIESGIDKFLEFLADLKPVEVLNRLKVEAPAQKIRYVVDDATLELELGKTGDYYWVREGGQVYQVEESHYKKPDVKLQDICERLMLKKRDAVESITLKTESGEKVLDKAKLPELRLEDFAPPEKRPESGVDQMKTVLTVKLREGRQVRDLVLVFGEQPADRKELRYVMVAGGETPAYVREELFQQLLK